MPGCAPRLLSRGWGEFQPPPPQNDDRITRVRKLEGPHLDAYRDLTGPLLLPDKEPETYDRAAARWHVRSVYDSKNVDLRESLAALALLAAIPRTGLRLRPWPSCSAGREGSSGQERFLSAARG